MLDTGVSSQDIWIEVHGERTGCRVIIGGIDVCHAHRSDDSYWTTSVITLVLVAFVPVVALTVIG